MEVVTPDALPPGCVFAIDLLVLKREKIQKFRFKSPKKAGNIRQRVTCNPMK
jgi:hypothetical protein